MGCDQFDDLRDALVVYDDQAVAQEARKALQEGCDPLEALDALSTTMREIGDRFDAGEIFLPELIFAADALHAGMDILLEALPKGAAKSPGRVLFGLAKGDVHDIGMMIVGAMLQAAGFEVVTLGIDTAAGAFAEEAAKTGADIVAISAAMSTTLPGLRDVIEYFEATGVRHNYQMMVGGASCTQLFADKIGADGYADDASQAIALAQELMGNREFSSTR